MTPAEAFAFVIGGLTGIAGCIGGIAIGRRIDRRRDK